MRELDNFYLQQNEPVKSCFLALREIILSQDAAVTNVWKYKGSFFCYKGKMFCYLWYHKKYKQPYIGIVEGNRFNDANLLQENRSRIKILLLDVNKDLPIKIINSILQQAINLYKTGEIKTREK